MKSIVFIVPYFGRLPDAIWRVWLKSVEKNRSIDWLIFTDDRTQYDYPDNTRVINISFDKFSALVKSRVGFKVPNPYKLCDFKPLYGENFENEIKEYDYWGHCDCTDVLFGDLRKFLTDEFLLSADKLLFLGHMSIYRNNPTVNHRYAMSYGGVLPIRRF